MRNFIKVNLLGIGLCLSVLVACCDPGPAETGAEILLKIRFATSRQAQHDFGGLPADVHSYQVQARAGALDGIPLGDTGCLDADSEESRQSVQIDLSPHEDVVLVVSGYAQSACSGNPTWMGVATGVQIVVGQEIKVPIYVTRRGLKLNDTRSELDPPRAFATATPLPDGRILIAGGFDKWDPWQGGAELDAACNAVIYDPGTATLSNPIPFKAGCRGFHQALVLMDGRVLLIGGTGHLSIRQDAVLSVVPSWQDANSAADLFDPQTQEFTLVGPVGELMRLDAAAVALGMRVILLGGRTTQLRSDAVVEGRQAGTDTWNWEVQTAQLSTGRSGARAVVLDDGILLAGGNSWGDGSSLDLLNKFSFVSIPLVLSAQAPAVTGHTLTRIDGQSAFMAGGIADYPGAVPGGTAVEIYLDGSSQTARELALARARVWHGAALLPDDQIVLAGGLDEDRIGGKDLEIVTPGVGSYLLEEHLGTGSFGVATATLPDGSILLAGGCDAVQDSVTLSGAVQLLSP